MKRVTKFWTASLATLIIATGIGLGANVGVSGVAKVNYNFIINDQKVDLPTDYLVMSKNNTTYVPLRFLSEQLGATVDYKSGTISVNTPPTTTMSQPSDNKKIADLEAEVAKLKKQNDELSARLNGINSTMTFRKLPTSVDSTNDLRIKLTYIEKVSDGADFTVEFTNRSENHYFIVDPYKTVVYIDGKEYKAGIKTDAVLNSTVNVDGEARVGKIHIDGLSNINVKGSMVFTLKDNGEKDDYVTIYFDNTK